MYRSCKFNVQRDARPLLQFPSDAGQRWRRRRSAAVGQQATDGRPTEGGEGRRREGVWEGGRHRREGGRE